MLNFFDFETFKHDWLVVIKNPIDKTTHKIANDVKALEDYHKQHQDEIWIGYNSRHYDQYILKAILCGFNPWDMNEWLIIKGLPGWQFSSVLREVNIINYDVGLLNKSLKQLEGFQGHNIHESDVDFMIDRKLTPEEIAQTFVYCENDVDECMNIFLETKSDFDAQLGLVKMFKLPLSSMSKTKAQISAEILECERQDFDDEWELFTLPCLKLDKYKNVAEWFLNKSNQDYSESLTAIVCGIRHDFGWGGLHGAKDKYHYRCGKDELIIHVDVASYYPSLMIFWNLLTRASKNPGRYKEIYDLRLALKHEGKKKEQAPLKIVLNGTFGICKDKNNPAYDPRNANLICINGQLLLLDLLEKLEVIPGFELIQSNTDGLIVKIPRSSFEQLDDVCYEWEHRTKMNLEFDYIKEIWQKDVNNYLFVQFDGKIERKGAYVKELSAIDNDLAIINKSLTDYMLKGVPVRTTINNCNNLMEFQKICKLTSKFDYVVDGSGEIHTNKCYRVFASKRDYDGIIYKVKTDGGKGDPRYYKFSNTSEKSFIENGNIVEAVVPDYLDKEWYINEAYKRLGQFGL